MMFVVHSDDEELLAIHAATQGIPDGEAHRFFDWLDKKITEVETLSAVIEGLAQRKLAMKFHSDAQEPVFLSPGEAKA